MIDDHSLQRVSRNFSQIQLQPQTRSSFDCPNSVSQVSGTIDMSFNRQHLDWSGLQLFAPHSTCSNRKSNTQATETRSTNDLCNQLDDWNFPSQPAFPPRLVVWGPYHKSVPHRTPLQALAPSTLQASPTQVSHSQTPVPYSYQAPKRRREGYKPPSRSSYVNPIAFTKRPRKAEKGTLKYPVSPRYTKYDICNQSSPTTPPNSGPSNFFNDYSMKNSSHHYTPPKPSPRYPNFNQNPGLYSRDADYQHRDQYDSHSFNSPLSCVTTPSPYHPNPNYMNQFYLHSPISPTTSFSPTLPSQSPSKFPPSQSPCANRYNHSNAQNSHHSNVWSREWHQTFHEFRNERTNYHF